MGTHWEAAKTTMHNITNTPHSSNITTIGAQHQHMGGSQPEQCLSACLYMQSLLQHRQHAFCHQSKQCCLNGSASTSCGFSVGVIDGRALPDMRICAVFARRRIDVEALSLRLNRNFPLLLPQESGPLANLRGQEAAGYLCQAGAARRQHLPD